MEFTEASADNALIDLEEEREKETKPKFSFAEKSEIPPDSPPKNSGRGRPKGSTNKVPNYKAGVIQNGVESTYSGLAMVWSMFDAQCGTAFLSCAPAAAEAWEELAKNDPRIRAMLMKVFTTSSWGKVIQAHIPLFIAIFAHHGMGRIVREHQDEPSQGFQPYQEPQYQGFQTDLFNQESPGMGVPSQEPDWEYWGAPSPTSVPNNGNGHTYQMPENPALRG